MTRRVFSSRRSLLQAAAGVGVLAALPRFAAAAAPTRPALFLIGDSTIRNGYFDDGETAGQFGWGHMLHYYFDTSRIDVVNDAMGGTSSRSFQESPALWTKVRLMIRPGDYVLMAFGHNDSRSSGKGNGDELVPAPPPFVRPGAPTPPPPPPDAPPKMMHSFGWYMRQYIEQVRALGATPIVMSLIPRNRWTDGKVLRNDDDYALWARQAAEQEHVQFIPLNTLIADEYDKLGQAKVQADLFPPNEAVHPNWAGAALNARIAVDGLKALDTPLKAYLVSDPQVPATPDITTAVRGEMGPGALAPKTRAPSSIPL